MLLFAELFFIALLLATLFMVSRNDGFAVRNKLRQAMLEGYWSGKNRRQYPRFAKSLEVAYSVLKRAVMVAKGETVNISEGGVKLLLDEKLPLGTTLNLKISLPHNGQVSEITGDVVWTEEAPDVKDPSDKRFFYSGIRFSSIKESSGKSFVDYIRSISPNQES